MTAAAPALHLVPAPTTRTSATTRSTDAVAALRQALDKSRKRRQGHAARLSALSDSDASAVLAALEDHAVRAGAAVSIIDTSTAGGSPASLFECLCAGRAPALSTYAACALAALEGRRLAQVHLLEGLLRRHARHRPLVLVVVDVAGPATDTAWILDQLPGLLQDTAVTWVRFGPAAGASRPAGTVTRLRRSASPPELTPGDGNRGRAERPRFGWASLTETELKVVELIADGHTNRSAATALFISANTVSTHLRSVFTKLDVNSRVQLTRVALRQASGLEALHRADSVRRPRA